MNNPREKTRQHCVRCTRAEWDEVKAQAALKGMKISEYVLACTLGEPSTGSGRPADADSDHDPSLSSGERDHQALLVDRLHRICARAMEPPTGPEGDENISTGEAIRILQAVDAERRFDEERDDDIYAALLSTDEGGSR